MFLALSLSDVFIMQINVVGILTFMSRINSVLSWVEHEKSFITSEPDITTSAERPTLKVHIPINVLDKYIVATGY